MGKAGLRRVFVGALVMSVVYTILASLAGSYFVERELQKLFAQTDEQDLAIGARLFNPFTLSATLDDLSLNEADGTTFLMVESARLDFSIISLLQQQFVFSEVSLQKPELVVDISVPHRPGLVRLLHTLSTVGDEDGGNAGIRIDQASVTAGRVHLLEVPARPGRQASETTPFEITFSEIDFQISHYQSGSVEPAGLELATRINESALLHANGHLLPSTRVLEARLQLADLDLAGLRPLFNSNSDSVRLSGLLRADGLLHHNPSATRFEGELAVDHFETGVEPQGQPLFSADELIVRGADIVAWPLHASAQVLELTQPRLELVVTPVDNSASVSMGHDPVLRWLLAAFAPSGKKRPGGGTENRVWPLSIDTLALSGGHIRMTDPRFGQDLHIGLQQVAGEITSHTAAPSKTMSMQLSASMGESGPLTLESVIQYSETQGRDDDSIVGEVITEVGLQQADASLLSAYFSRLAGRKIVSGTLQLGLGYRIENDMLAISSEISFRQLAFEARSVFAPINDLPLELLIALFTDPLGETRFELPLLSHLTDSAGSIPAAIEIEMANFIGDVTASPFTMLANLVDFREVALNSIVFDPGSAAISPLAERQLIALGEVLDRRPGLGLRAISGQARQADRTALAQRQISLHVTLAASTRPTGRPDQATLDFTDPKVQTVLDEFASTRLAANELAGLNARQQLNSEAASPTEYYEAVLEALVAREPVAENALRQLANFRAQSVIRKLESLGIATRRLQLGNSQRADDPPISLQVFAQAQAKANARLWP